MNATLQSTPDNPVPENHVAGMFEGVDGVKIRYAVFRSAEPAAKGTVVLLQGRNETIEKYYETIGELTAHGLWVATFDWRGQGGSGRLLKDAWRGHLRRFSDLERDLSIFLEHIVLPDTRLPFFILAHSMGALVALSLAPAIQNRVERMVLAAPFVGLGGQPVSQGHIRFMARVASFFGFGWVTFGKDPSRHPFEGNNLTHDAARFARNRAIAATFPEFSLGAPTARWLRELLGAIRRINRRDHLTNIAVPAIVLSPTRDSIVPRAFTDRFMRNFRAGQLIEIDGARHELLQEEDRYRAQAMAAIFAFLPGSDAEKSSRET